MNYEIIKFNIKMIQKFVDKNLETPIDKFEFQFQSTLVK